MNVQISVGKKIGGERKGCGVEIGGKYAAQLESCRKEGWAIWETHRR